MAGNVSNISFHASTFVQVWLFTIFHRTFLPVCLIYPALWPPLLHNRLPCVRGTFCSKASPRIYTGTDHHPMATRVWDDLLCQTFSTCNTVWYFIKKKNDAEISLSAPSAVEMNAARVATWEGSLLLSVAWHKALVVFTAAYKCTTPSSLVHRSCRLRVNIMCGCLRNKCVHRC